MKPEPDWRGEHLIKAPTPAPVPINQKPLIDNKLPYRKKEPRVRQCTVEGCESYL